jgi:hypothetical protein
MFHGVLYFFFRRHVVPEMYERAAIRKLAQANWKENGKACYNETYGFNYLGEGYTMCR